MRHIEQDDDGNDLKNGIEVTIPILLLEDDDEVFTAATRHRINQ